MEKIIDHITDRYDKKIIQSIFAKFFKLMIKFIENFIEILQFTLSPYFKLTFAYNDSRVRLLVRIFGNNHLNFKFSKLRQLSIITADEKVCLTQYAA